MPQRHTPPKQPDASAGDPLDPFTARSRLEVRHRIPVCLFTGVHGRGQVLFMTRDVRSAFLIYIGGRAAQIFALAPHEFGAVIGLRLQKVRALACFVLQQLPGFLTRLRRQKDAGRHAQAQSQQKIGKPVFLFHNSLLHTYLKCNRIPHGRAGWKSKAPRTGKTLTWIKLTLLRPCYTLSRFAPAWSLAVRRKSSAPTGSGNTLCASWVSAPTRLAKCA